MEDKASVGCGLMGVGWANPDTHSLACSLFASFGQAMVMWWKHSEHSTIITLHVHKSTVPTPTPAQSPTFWMLAALP